MMNKKHVRTLFFLYLLILLKVIVFKYPLQQMQEIAASWQKDVFWEGLQGANFTLFKTIKMYIRHWDNRGLNSFGNLVGNVVAFIPLGYLLPRVQKAFENIFLCIGAGALIIVGIELFQLLSAFGVFDVDDILLNCVGVFIGYLFFCVMKLFMYKKRLIK